MKATIKIFFRSDSFLGAFLGLLAFGIYLSTLAVTIQFEDAGEIAASLYTLGILHPTGYPLFTLLGWAFSHLPMGGCVIWRLNLLMAILCAVSVVLFYRVFLALLSKTSTEATGKKGRDAKAPPDILSDRLSAAAAALTLAFSRTFWSEALSIEVYALHLLFLSLVMLLFLRALAGGKGEQGWRRDRTWMGFALALGLSFTNHMMTVLLAPAFLYLFFATHGFGRAAWTRIARAVPPFLLGLSVYLYLPLRAAQHPLMNWGNPSTFERFWWHVSGKQFRFNMFPSAEVMFRKSEKFFAAFPSEFAYAPLLLALLGLWFLYRQNLRLLLFSLLLFWGCLFYSTNYEFDDPNYYLNAYAATAIWILYGIRSILEYVQGRKLRRPALALCGTFALLPLCLNYRVADESRDYAVEDYTKNMLAPLDSGAVVISQQWGYFTSAAYYLQLVEKFRPDVAVIDRELLSSPWYYAQLERQHPWLIQNSRAEVDAFLGELYKFDRGLPLTRAVLRERFKEVMQSLISKSSETRSVYVTADISQELTAGFQRVPSGLAFRLCRGTYPPPSASPPEFVFRSLPPRGNDLIEHIRTYYAAAYINHGLYRVMLGDRTTGTAYIRKALETKPDFPPASDWLKRLGTGH